MNATLTAGGSVPTPNFVGLVRGEFFKLSRQRPIIVLAIIIAIVQIVYGLRTVIFLANLPQELVNRGASATVYLTTRVGMSDIRGLLGVFVTVVAVIVVGLEYQQGTIRVLLARGVGRLRLLAAKVTAITLLGVAGFIVMLVIMYLAMFISFAVIHRSGDFGQLPPYYFGDVTLDGLLVLLNMFVTLMLGVTLAVIGRNLAFGLAIGLPFFIAETIVGGILRVVSAIAQNDVWTHIATFLPGANLSQLSLTLVPDHGLQVFIEALSLNVTNGFIDGQHALTAVILYGLAFIGISGYLTWQRDVLQ